MRTKLLLFFILCVATLLRLAFLSHGQVLGDEPLYTVRSIGWIDMLGSDLQTTPIQWFADPPWWVFLSFHDHPPLTFAINHLFFRLFDDTIFVSRLPAALFGVGGTLLVFGIAKSLFKKDTVALLAAALFAVNDFSIFYARIAMMESVTLFFILLAFYLFLRSLGNQRLLPWFGIALGLSILAKYVAFVTIPVYLAVILVYKRSWLTTARFYCGIVLCLIITSPIIIYNVELYRAVHHFDLQFSFLLGQETPEWQDLIGKNQRGDIAERLRDTASFVFFLSPVISIVSFAGFLLACLQLRHTKEDRAQQITFLALTVAYILFPLLVGGLARFLYLLVPFTILLSAWFLLRLFSHPSTTKNIVLSLIIIYEFFFGLNTNVIAAVTEPIGPAPLTHSAELILADYRLADLDTYLEEKLSPYRPLLVPKTRVQTMNEIIAEAAQKNTEKPPKKIFLFFDNRFDLRVVLWSISRHSFYEGWGIRVAGNSIDFAQSLAAQHPDTVVYYIHSTKHSARNPNALELPVDHDILAQALEQRIRPDIIYNKKDQPVFVIYPTTAPVLADVYREITSASYGSPRDSIVQ